MSHEVETVPDRPLTGLARLDACAQADLVRTGEATALEIVEAAIDRIERLNPHLNAIASVNFEAACDRAKTVPRTALFSGVPTLLKDVLPYPGHPAGFGSRLLDGAPALAGSEYTQALDNSGLVVLGKSTTSEFGLLGTTETLAKGATGNPWDLTRSPGGSSGGAVAAVASGMVPVAHASDGGGSIRGPASFCGVFGFKPSRGRTFFNGVPSELPTSALLADHCVSRSVRDSSVWLQATEREDLSDRLPSVDTLSNRSLRGLRIGFHRTDCAGNLPEPEAEAALLATAKLCESLGCDVFEMKPPDVDSTALVESFFALTSLMLSGVFAQIKGMMGEVFSEDRLEPYTVELARRADELAPDTVNASQRTLAESAAKAEMVWKDCDVLLSPTVPFAAFPLGKYLPSSAPEVLMSFTERLAGYTFIASITGWPAMSVPLHSSADGLPLGSHFAARHGQDELLHSLAFRLEQARPWKPRLDALTESLLCRND